VSRNALLPGLGGVVLFVLLWEVLVDAFGGGLTSLPPPSTVALALGDLFRSGTLLEETEHTLLATFLGWAISVGIGLTLGTLLGLSATARRYSLASIEVLRPLPAVAFVPLALLLFGFSLPMELVVICYVAMWPALVNAMAGVAGVPQRLHDVARALRLTRFEAVTRIFIPAAAPAVLVGCRLSLTLSLILAVAAEMIGNPAGLGYAVVREAQSMHPDLMFGYVFILGLIGIVLNALLVGAARLILPGEFRRPAVDWGGR
jgi:ABC-type nitrate/sulfonate/bicarbonate transport system permease component